MSSCVYRFSFGIIPFGHRLERPVGRLFVLTTNLLEQGGSSHAIDVITCDDHTTSDSWGRGGGGGGGGAKATKSTDVKANTCFAVTSGCAWPTATRVAGGERLALSSVLTRQRPTRVVVNYTGTRTQTCHTRSVVLSPRAIVRSPNNPVAIAPTINNK